MVLKGTDSSIGLAVVGFLIAGWGVFQMMDEPKAGGTRKNTRSKGGDRAAPRSGAGPGPKKKNPFRK